MLAKNFRLTKQSDFDNVFLKGTKVFGKSFIIRFLVNLDKNTKVAIIVSNKVSKKATSRNKVKRQIREILRKNLSNFTNNFDVIVTVLSPCVDLEFSQLESELIRSFKKANIIK